MRWLFSKVMVEAYANSHSLPELVAEYSEATCSARESTPDVAPQELRKEEQMGGPVNCNDSELSIYLQALAEGYLPTFYSDTSQSAQSKSMSIASKSFRRGKKTVVFHGFPSLKMSRHSTEDLGAALLTWFLADSRVRTYPLPGLEPELTVIGQDCGVKWHESSVRFDPVSCSWKTAHCLWEEDLPWCSVTLPKWGLMRNGHVYQHPTLMRPISVTAFGLWPTPTVHGNYNKPGASKTSGTGLATAVKLWPTPQARDNRDRGSLSTPSVRRRVEKGKQVMLSMCVSSKNGRLNPDWTEWLMGWPIGWTGLKPLETDKFREWQRQHSPCSQKSNRESA